jgi:hypothetical protein
MILSVPPSAETVVYARTFDRADSAEGRSLRDAIEVALRPAFGRSDEIYDRLARALTKAQETEGLRVDPDAFTRAWRILELIPNDIPLPDVVVESDGSIGLDWDVSADRLISLTVRGEQAFGFSALMHGDPLYGRTSLVDRLPETLRSLLRRLYPTNTGSSAA